MNLVVDRHQQRDLQLVNVQRESQFGSLSGMSLSKPSLQGSEIYVEHDDVLEVGDDSKGTGLMHTGSHRDCDSTLRTWTISSQTKSQQSKGRLDKGPIFI